MLTHGSLFSGIGGFQLAAQWMGWENVMSCEIEDFCNKITGYYWPNCKQHEDIRTTDFTFWRERIDIITGGFPCQPYSTAGKRLGKEDDRHLWPEMLRAIREIQPRWVVGENVSGLVSWNGGLVFEEVQANLEAEGYKVQPFILPAAGVEAPHRRDRVWFIAYSGSEAREQDTGFEWEMYFKEWHEVRGQSKSIGEKQYVTNPTSSRFSKEKYWKAKSGRVAEIGFPRNWNNFPTQSPLRNGNDGVPSKLHGITLSSWIIKSIESMGNAIVPQVGFQIFKAIQQYENLSR